jgi:hypothetical protein
MSFNKTIELLRLATDSFKIEKAGCRHSLCMENDKLMLTLVIGMEPTFKSFLLDEQDLEKDPETIILEIYDFLGRK